MAINKNFVIRNGLEVANNLIIADDVTNKVGIWTTFPLFELDVRGDVTPTQFNAALRTDSGTPSWTYYWFAIGV